MGPDPLAVDVPPGPAGPETPINSASNGGVPLQMPRDSGNPRPSGNRRPSGSYVKERSPGYPWRVSHLRDHGVSYRQALSAHLSCRLIGFRAFVFQPYQEAGFAQRGAVQQDGGGMVPWPLDRYPE